MYLPVAICSSWPLGAPFRRLCGLRFTLKRGIDEHKLFPLFLGRGQLWADHAGHLQGRNPARRLPLASRTAPRRSSTVPKIGIVMQLVGISGLRRRRGVVTALVLGFSLWRKDHRYLKVDENDQADGLDQKSLGDHSASTGRNRPRRK